MSGRIIKPCALLFMVVVLICACQNRPSKTSEVPRVISHSFKIMIAPFTQPHDNADLISGQLPEIQGQIPVNIQARLDIRFHHLLKKKNSRKYIFGASPATVPMKSQWRSSASPLALDRWLAYGQIHNADILLVPFIIDWHEREGSRMGITRPAHVKMDFFLLNIKDASILNRFTYEEEQKGLADNLLSVGLFLKRKGSWVSADVLAVEGMTKVIKEFGL